MSNLGRILISAATIVALAVFASGAQAANVILGSPLIGFFNQTPVCGGPCTLVQDALVGATLRSPVDGVVVRWQLIGGDPFHFYKLRVLKPAGGLELTGVGSSDQVTPLGTAKETFPTALPIQAGQAIGINLIPGALLGERPIVGSSFSAFKPILVDGATRTPTETPRPGELGFNAEVQPAPKIAAIAPASGSLRGGSTVTIAGTDLEGASAVSFGGVPATSYRVDSEAQITAVAPPAATPSAVPVSVTTLAGSATAAQSFTYEACRVPKLGGKTLKVAKRLLRRSNCRLGRVKRHYGITARRTKVVAQSPKPGKLLSPGAKIKLTVVDRPTDI